MSMNYTYDINQFIAMIATQKGRMNIITEGDSWFGYPSNTLLMGHGSNIIDHIADTNKFNLLRLESSGDEASCMMSQEQRHRFIDLIQMLNKYHRKLDCILFSGGGNDIVGEDDLPFFLNDYVEGMTAHDCIKWNRLNIRMKQIEVAYEELIALRDELCTDTRIITHGYDYPIPSGIPGTFLLGIKTKPWIKPYLDQKGINVSLHVPIVRLIIDRLNEVLDGLQKNKRNFVKVELRELLQPSEWLNEIHPTPDGFKKVADEFLKLCP